MTDTAQIDWPDDFVAAAEQTPDTSRVPLRLTVSHLKSGVKLALTLTPGLLAQLAWRDDERLAVFSAETETHLFYRVRPDTKGRYRVRTRRLSNATVHRAHLSGLADIGAAACDKVEPTYQTSGSLLTLALPRGANPLVVRQTKARPAPAVVVKDDGIRWSDHDDLKIRNAAKSGKWGACAIAIGRNVTEDQIKRRAMALKLSGHG